METKESFQIVYAELRKRILYGIYPDKFHLVVEHLSREFSVGKSVIQRVLQSLEQERLVENLKGRGFFVSCPNRQEDLLGLRNELETSAMRQVVNRISENELKQLEYLADDVDQNKTEFDLVRYVDGEVAFHRYLVSCSGNDYLIHMHENLIDLVKQYLSTYYKELFQVFQNARNMSGLMSHRMVVESIYFARRQKAPDVAIQVLKIHLTPPKGIVEALAAYDRTL